MSLEPNDSEHPLQKAWDLKRALRHCRRGHPLPEYLGFGTVRRCAICDRMRQLITDSKNKIGPVMFRLALPRGPKTHCPKGHPYAGENVRIAPKGQVCRTCARESIAKWKAQKIEAGENPNRWKPTIRTVERFIGAAKSGMSLSEMKGRSKGFKALASPNTLINIRLWYPEKWAQASTLLARTKHLRHAGGAADVASRAVPVVLDPQTAAELMQLAYRLMPRFLSGHDRDEAVQNLVTAVVLGELNIGDVNAKTAKRFAANESVFNRHGSVSLNADLTGNGFTLLDTIQEDAAWNVPLNTGRRIVARRY